MVALLVIRIDEPNLPLTEGSNITVTVLVCPGARSKEPPPLIIENGAEGDPTQRTYGAVHVNRLHEVLLAFPAKVYH